MPRAWAMVVVLLTLEASAFVFPGRGLLQKVSSSCSGHQYTQQGRTHTHTATRLETQAMIERSAGAVWSLPIGNG